MRFRTLLLGSAASGILLQTSDCMRFSKEQAALMSLPSQMEQQWSPDEMRFVQARAKSKWSLFMWLANLIDPVRESGRYENHRAMNCSGGLFESLEECESAKQSANPLFWEIDCSSGEVNFMAGEPFHEESPLWNFFIFPKRWSIGSPLMFKDYKCNRTRTSAWMKIGTADEAGFAIRVKDLRNAYVFVLAPGAKPSVFAIEDGERVLIGQIDMPPILRHRWYHSELQDLGGDPVFTVRPQGAAASQWRSNPKAIEDYEKVTAAAAGLIASGGTATFLNPASGPANLAPVGKIAEEHERRVAASTPAAPESTLNVDHLDQLLGYCPPGSLCAGPPYYYPEQNGASRFLQTQLVAK